MSESEVEKGTRSLHEIGKALADIKVGIVCLTPENLDRAWLLYEAGCRSKSIDERTRLCTYLIADLEPSDVRAVRHVSSDPRHKGRNAETTEDYQPRRRR